MKNVYKKFILLLLAGLVCLPVFLSAQNSKPYFDKCLADVMDQEMLANDPECANNQAILERETEEYTAQYLASRQNGNQEKNASVLKVIPVVFHIIHEGGSENITRAQCLNQLLMVRLPRPAVSK
jgi:hypothetical protein